MNINKLNDLDSTISSSLEEIYSMCIEENNKHIELQNIVSEMLELESKMYVLIQELKLKNIMK
jgi:hypothetical protein